MQRRHDYFLSLCHRLLLLICPPFKKLGHLDFDKRKRNLFRDSQPFFAKSGRLGYNQRQKSSSVNLVRCLMYRRFASHIELRMDRRLTFLLLLGGLVWTLLTFFFGMMVGGSGSQKKINQKLAGMGWMTLEKYRLEELCRQKHLASGHRSPTALPSATHVAPRPVRRTPVSDWKQRKLLAARWRNLALAPNRRRPVAKSKTSVRRPPAPPRLRKKPKPRKVARLKAGDLRKKSRKLQKRYGFVSHKRAKYTLFVRARSSYKSLIKIRRFFRRKGYGSMLQLRSTRRGRRYVMTSGRFRNRSKAARFQRLLRRRHGFRTRIIKLK
jgi:hypothetical protein